MPGAHDVALADAAVAEGLITREQADHVLAEIARVEGIGGSVSLESVLINKALITQQQIDKLKESLGRVRLPRQLAGFHIIQPAGRTRHSMLFKARQTSMDRFALLKVLSPRLAGNTRYVERLLHETDAAATVAHENLLQVYEAGQASGFCYVAYEWIDGETLSARLAREGRLKLSDALAIAEQMCMALQYAHGQHTCHGRITPDRIMVAKSGTAKLADLGLCRADAEAPELQAEPPLYQSPEQASGAAADIRSDIYSLGAVLFHMATGVAPFGGATAHDVATAHIRTALPTPNVLNPALSPEASGLIQNMMAKSPAERYRDPEDLLQEIQSVRMGMPLRKTRSTRPHVLHQRAEPQRPQVSVAGVAVAALVALMLIVGGIVVLSGKKSVPPGIVPRDIREPAPRVGSGFTSEAINERAERALLVADDYHARNPQEVSRAIDKYLAIVSTYPRTEAARKAETKAAELQARREAEARAAFERAKADAESFAAAGEFGRAIEALRAFPDSFRFGQWKTAAPEQVALMERRARERFNQLMEGAEKLAARKKYSEALKLLEPGDNLGVEELTRIIRARRGRYQRELEQAKAVDSAEAARAWPALVKSVARYEKRHLLEQAAKECEAFSGKFAVSLGGPDTPLSLKLAELQAEVENSRAVWEKVGGGLRRIKGEADLRLNSAVVSGEISEVTGSTFTIGGARRRISEIELQEALRIAGIEGADEPAVICRVRFLLAEGDTDAATAAADGLEGIKKAQCLERIQERKKLVGTSEEVDKALAVLDHLQQRAAKQQWKPLYLGLSSFSTTFPRKVIREVENEYRALRLQAETGIARDLKLQNVTEGEFIDLLDLLRERDKWLRESKCPKSVPCPNCAGTTQRGGSCVACGGKGTISRGGITFVCPQCNGSRKFVCDTCRGAKVIRCGQCMGRGYRGSMPTEYADAATELNARYQLKPEDVLLYIKE